MLRSFKKTTQILRSFYSLVYQEIRTGDLKSKFAFLNLFKLSKSIVFPTQTAEFW